MRRNGTRIKQLTHEPDSADAIHPAYSPDGDRIAALAYRAGQTREILIWNLDGSRPRKIERPGDDRFDGGLSWQPVHRP